MGLIYWVAFQALYHDWEDSTESVKVTDSDFDALLINALQER